MLNQLAKLRSITTVSPSNELTVFVVLTLGSPVRILFGVFNECPVQKEALQWADLSSEKF
jgi:hypothetical protein